jgi:hypothetical protein
MTVPASSPPKLTEISKSVGWRLAREHPTLLLTLIYLAVTFVGLVHDLWFYRYFGINILEFSETSDFLLAAMRNPLVIILALLPIAILRIGQTLRETAIKKSERYERYAKKYENTRWNSVVARSFIYGWFIVVYAILFTQLYAAREVSRIKSGKSGHRVSFMRTDGIVSDEQPILLGTTGKFIFLYSRTRKATEIVPIDNTAAITVDSRRRKEREADSLAKADSAATREAPADSDTASENPD